MALPLPGNDNAPAPARRSARPLVLLFAALCLSVCAVAYLDLSHNATELMKAEQQEQANVLALNVRNIQSWMAAREADLHLIENGIEQIYGNADLRSTEVLNAIEQFFSESLRRVDSWSQVALYAPDGGLLLHLGADLPRPPAEMIVAVAAQSEIVTEFPAEADTDATGFRMNMLVRLERPNQAAPLGVVMLSVNPRRLLRAVAGFWPDPGETSDMFLLRHVQDRVHVYASKQNGGPYSLASLNARQTLEAAAIARREGSFAGPDRHDKAVIGAFTVVPDTPWHFLAQTDRAEILEPMFQRRVIVVLTALFLIATAGLVAILLWRNQQLAYLAESRRQRRDRTAAAQHFDKFFALARDIYLLLDETGRIIEANKAAEGAYGYSRDELLTMTIRDLRAPNTNDSLDRQWQAAAARDGTLFETLHQRRHGVSFPVEVSSRTLEIDGKIYRQSLVRDISLRKAAEQSVKDMNRVIMAIRLANSILLRSQNEADTFDDMCRAIVDVGHYRMACIGLAIDDAGKSVRIAAMAGEGTDYLAGVNISWGDGPRGQGPTGTAIRTGKIEVNGNFATNPRMAPWRESAMAHGFCSSISLPLKSDGKVFGVLGIYAANADAFDNAEEVALLAELAEDVSFAVGVMRLRGRERENAQKLALSFERTIRLLAETMELRDPYTSGHQHRVAELASAIAIEMKLSEEEVHGIYLAGLVHDIGKIAVPSEFLSKPSRLTPQEMAVVKTHSAVGADLIKEIDFQWPIAAIVRGHHEKLDGSGYPDGLKDGEICVGARIMAVADIVEAISAHRPYRPALGLERAFEEIERERGVQLDPAAVDACLALFRSGRFRFPDPN